jgi:uncharacterized protein (DUF1778 family)
MTDTQISAFVSESTRRKIDRYAEAHGVKKSHLVEEALLHHLLALCELPADLVIPPRLTVSVKSFDTVVGAIDKPRRPTRAMRALLAGEPVDPPS